MIPGVILAALVLVVIGLVVALSSFRKRLVEALRVSSKFQPIADLDAEFQKIAGDRDHARQVLAELTRQVATARAEIVQLDDTANMQGVGLYRKQFDFRDAEEYRRKLDMLRDHQEAMVKGGLAAVCTTAWQVNNSVTEGKRTTTKILKLMLRAFNGECDALIGRVRYDNIASFTVRMRKSYETIDKLGSGFTCRITDEYLKLKLQELALVYEYQEQVQAEKEEQRRIREEMRDEEKRAQEIAKLQKEAAADEVRYTTLLERARKEAHDAEGERQQRLLAHIVELEDSLRTAREKAERAKSQAQLTRAGHVYVLSNIGSFGDDVVKIGMTRRLEPEERVYELSDASVPFAFDVHAMIYTEDAPKLERALHELFEERRVNRVNHRKEFFRAPLDEVEEVVRKHHGEFKLTKVAEAIEYRKTLAIISPARPEGIRVSEGAVLVSGPSVVED